MKVRYYLDVTNFLYAVLLLMFLKFKECSLEGHMVILEKYCIFLGLMTLIIFVILKQFGIFLLLYQYIIGTWSLLLGMFLTYLYIKYLNLDLFFYRLRYQEPLSRIMTDINSKKKEDKIENFKIKHLKDKMFCPYYHPDIEINISKDIDKSVQKFLELTLQHYILSWYRYILDVRNFSLFQALLVRNSNVSIKDKFIKTFISHIDMYQILCGEILANAKGEELEKLILEKASSHLHITIYSRKREIQYLRHLTTELLPLLLPENSIKSSILSSLLQEILACRILLPCMDIVSNPDFVNYLILVLFEGNIILYPQQTDNKVILLKQFVSQYPMKCDVPPRLTLKEIVHNQDLLFIFMNFMKSEGVLNIIQFYMSLEDFMKLILNPDLKVPQIDILYRQCQQIYSNFFDQSSADRIDFDEQTIHQMKQITEQSANNVLRLRNTSPLYTAREHVVSLLENIFIPLFCKSSSFSNWELGGKSMFTAGKNNAKASKKGSEMLVAVSKLGNRIKGAFKTSTIDGQMMAEECSTENDDSVEDEIGSVGNDLPDLMGPGANRDLSTFTITIPKIESRIEAGGKQNFVFIIYVQKLESNSPTEASASTSGGTIDDMENPYSSSPLNQESLWYVERRYPEFYVLESKLAEFHGMFEDIQLPAKRVFSAKDWAFINAKKPLFENYLQKLCNKSELRNSELLHNFLTSQEEFISSFLPDINIGKMFKAPLRLLPEKGQHLDPFLQSFVASTETVKIKNRNSASTPQMLPDHLDRTFAKHLYNNPMYERCLGVETNSGKGQTSSPSHVKKTNGAGNKKRKQYAISGFYDYIIYFCFNIFHVPEWIIRVLLAFRLGIKPIFERYLDTKLNQKIMRLEHPAFIVDLINMLQNAIYPDEIKQKSVKESKSEMVSLTQNMSKEKKAAYALELLQKQMHSLKWLLPEKNIQEGTLLLFDCFQHPILNKHLTYVLLDTIIGELFPELSAPVEKQK